MLVITRRHNEELLIGGDVRVRVLSIRGNRVQLGIDAPEYIRVQRNDQEREFAGDPFGREPSLLTR
jgi:carbon storage regulator CsrA